ncbi:MAG TPA: TIGR01777 family oxidoreductase [Longimicrobiales bacterium]|nr:TIGR01777 family oxidoreductase [Longimicrobiales bacterium]
MRVAITGFTGFIGTAIGRYLMELGHDVTPVVRTLGGAGRDRAVVWHPDRGVIDAQGLEGHDLVIHLAGESIAGVWTDGKKRRIRESRVQGTTLLARTLASLDARPRALFSASAFGIYGDQPGQKRLDETASTGEGFLADVGRAWEAATEPAAAAGIRVVHMRFGNVLSPVGGMLDALLPLFRIGLGARLGSGRQMWPWIALDDIPPALVHVLGRPEISGPVNFAAPEPVTNREFTDTLAAVLGRPSFLSVPRMALNLAPGGMGEEMLLASAPVIPRRLLDSGYPFRWPELEPALRAMLGRD